jgi:hypothetical protein
VKKHTQTVAAFVVLALMCRGVHADEPGQIEAARTILGACMDSAKTERPLDTALIEKYMKQPEAQSFYVSYGDLPPLALAIIYKGIMRCVLTGPGEVKDSAFGKAIMETARSWPGVKCKVDRKITGSPETCALPANRKEGARARSVSAQISGDGKWTAIIWAGG